VVVLVIYIIVKCAKNTKVLEKNITPPQTERKQPNVKTIPIPHLRGRDAYIIAGGKR
jgi:hypothetical protein